MDAIQMIRDDHRRVQTLFRDFEEASDAQTKKAIFDNIYIELDVHTTLEEEIFYPSVQRQGERETVRHAEEEHGLVKELLNEMVKLDAKDSSFESKFHVLKDNVQDHGERLALDVRAREDGNEPHRDHDQSTARNRWRLAVDRASASDDPRRKHSEQAGRPPQRKPLGRRPLGAAYANDRENRN